MEDYNTPAAIKARAEQEDPIVMYIIVHESLGMSVGKTAAQCAHASQMLTLMFFEFKENCKHLQNVMSVNDNTNKDEIINHYKALATEIAIFSEWLNSSFRKVVLKADDKEWVKLKEEFTESMVVVVDAGLTEIMAGSETCIGLWPMRKSQVPKLVKRLQLLK